MAARPARTAPGDPDPRLLTRAPAAVARRGAGRWSRSRWIAAPAGCSGSGPRTTTCWCPSTSPAVTRRTSSTATAVGSIRAPAHRRCSSPTAPPATPARTSSARWDSAARAYSGCGGPGGLPWPERGGRAVLGHNARSGHLRPPRGRSARPLSGTAAQPRPGGRAPPDGRAARAATTARSPGASHRAGAGRPAAPRHCTRSGPTGTPAADRRRTVRTSPPQPGRSATGPSGAHTGDSDQDAASRPVAPWQFPDLLRFGISAARVL